VIGGAMGGVWLGFLPGLRRKVLKMGKVTKKKVVKIFGRPLSKFLNTSLAAVNRAARQRAAVTSRSLGTRLVKLKLNLVNFFRICCTNPKQI
jgi:hypothetical protein